LFLKEFVLIYIRENKSKNKIGDWGLGIGDCGLGPITNPQSPKPTTHFLIYYI